MISDHYKPVKRSLKGGDPRKIKQSEKSRRKRGLSLFLIFHSLLSSPESRRLMQFSGRGSRENSLCYFMTRNPSCCSKAFDILCDIQIFA